MYKLKKVIFIVVKPFFTLLLIIYFIFNTVYVIYCVLTFIVLKI